MRLGIDPGSVRIGVARCDPDGLLATPLDTVPRGPGDLDRLVRLALEHDAVEVIVGLPTGLSGREGAAATAARSFADAAGRPPGADPGPPGGRAVHHRAGPRRAAPGRQGRAGPAAGRRSGGRRPAAAGSPGRGAGRRAASWRDRPDQPRDGRVSRHGRRGTQGDDEQWGPGDYPPADADELFAPGDYGQARRDWPRNPIATADTGDFPPVADPSLPPGSYPRDPGGRRSADFDWGPDPLGLDTRDSRGRGAGPRGSDPPGFEPQGFEPHGSEPHGFEPQGSGARGGGRPGGQPRPEPMAPDRWAPQSWEPPSWERASWDSQTAGSAGWLSPPGASPDWAEHGDPPGDPRGAASGGFDDLQAGELPPLPPGPMPGSGHPSGPLPPLPESDYLWGEPPSGPLPPAAPRSRPGRGEDDPGGGRAGGRPTRRAGLSPADTRRTRRATRMTGPVTRVTGPVFPTTGPATRKTGRATRTIPAATCTDREESADYPAPRGRRRRRRSAEPDVGPGSSGV